MFKMAKTQGNKLILKGRDYDQVFGKLLLKKTKKTWSLL